MYCPRVGLLKASMGSLNRLHVVIWDDLIRLRWITLILNVVLIDLCLCILRYGRLIGGCGVAVVALARRGILDQV